MLKSSSLALLLIAIASGSFPGFAAGTPVPISPPSPIAAAIVQPPPSPAASTGTEDGFSLAPEFPVFRTLGGFGVVLSLMLVGFFGVRRYAPQLLRKPAGERSLRVLETLPIGDRRSLAVIQVEDKRFLVGHTPHQITLLASLPGAFSLAEPAISTEEAAPLTTARTASERFRNLYEVERSTSLRTPAKPKTIPPDIRAKMRQLRETLEK
jgi:flagellar biosynthetic protein FliO